MCQALVWLAAVLASGLGYLRRGAFAAAGPALVVALGMGSGLAGEAPLEERLHSADLQVLFSALTEVRQLPIGGRKPYLPHLSALLTDDDQTIRLLSAELLCDLAEPATSVISTLIANFRQPNGEEAVSYALCVARFGELAVPALTTALESDSYFVRSHAMTALGKIGPAAGAALPTLQAMVDNPTAMLNTATLGAPPQYRAISMATEAQNAIRAIKADR